MDHEAEEQLAAYALGALDLEERLQVKAHLEGCPSCRAALAAYESVTQGLLHAADPKPPPRSIRSSLAKQLGNTRTRARWRRTLQRVPATGLGLAVGLILLLTVNVGILVQSQRLLKQGQEALAQQQAGQTAVALASSPSSKVALIEEDGLRGTFVYDPGLPVAVMYVWGLPPLPDDQAYQAWLVDAQGERLSGGLITFGADPGFGWLLIQAPTMMEEYIGLGVTLEPAGGSAEPTGPRILGADL